MRLLALLAAAAPARAAIDRRAVVSRHDPAFSAPAAADLDLRDTFTLGNGAFAFNADVTGLQTFNASYAFGVNTLSDWQMHTTPWSAADPAFALRAYNFTYYDTPLDGRGATRRVPYANAGANDPAVVSWLMRNPHRQNLGQLSLRFASGGGAPTRPVPLAAVSAAAQRLALWEGALSSNFSLADGGNSSARATCALGDDNTVLELSCGTGGGVITGVPFASYGLPSGSCARGFVPAPHCASRNASAVLAARCVGRASCSVLVNWKAGFGDPCAGKAKALAANVTCSAPPPPPGPPPASFPVAVRTVVDPDVDLVAVEVACAAPPCALALRLAFAYGAPSPSGADWDAPAGAHATVVARNASGAAQPGGRGGATFLRTLDADAYRVDCAWDGGLELRAARDAPHAFDLVAPGGALWTAARVSCLFAPAGAAGEPAYPVGAAAPWLAAKARATRALLAGAAGDLPLLPTAAAAAGAAWAAYWTGGAFLDLASATGAADALELERRVVLSRYLVRANSAGAEPPQETGLLVNSWGGKHHNE